MSASAPWPHTRLEQTHLPSENTDQCSYISCEVRFVFLESNKHFSGIDLLLRLCATIVYSIASTINVRIHTSLCFRLPRVTTDGHDLILPPAPYLFNFLSLFFPANFVTHLMVVYYN